MADITQMILDRLKSGSPGTAFALKAFEDLGNHAIVSRALRRLIKAGKVRRICRSVFDIPRDHPTLGPLSPDPDAVARAIAACSQLRCTRQTCLVSHHRCPRRLFTWLMAVLGKLPWVIVLST